MMTTTSYLFALFIYWLAAGVGCRLLYMIVFRHLSPMWSGATTGLVAGLLLVPSYAAADATTLAPALITGVFNLLFAGGMEAAVGAFLMLSLGAVVGVIVGIITVRLSTSRPSQQ
jgi:hypothetical protein